MKTQRDMRLFLKLSLILICILLSAATVFFSLFSGDLLIDYLANSLGLRIFYTNRCGFASAFIFKMANLKSPVLRILESPLKMKCENADIWFDYSKVLTKGVIGLYCQFNKPIFLGTSSSQEKEPTFIDVFPALLFSMLGETADFQYDYIFCDLLMHGDTAEILNFVAISEQIIMRARGLATNKGQVDIDLETLFSPEFVANLPEEGKLLLEEKSNGWMSFRIRVKSSKEEPFLQLESDRFRLSIEEREG